GDAHVGFVGEIAPAVGDAFGLDHRAAAFELNLDVVAALPATVASYHPVPTQPDAKRDLAFVVADRAAFADVERSLRGASSLIVDVELFDVYRGKGVEEGKKSLAVHLTLRAADRTLTSEEADAEVAKCVAVLGKEFGATMRA
ncbi:phenylalanine--tRNA ligase subunit beta, partial [bacterium]|nr:phenylalanine--tRNA ligase subunit beta [bacterium]